MKKRLIVLSGFVLALAPIMALAQTNTGGNVTSVCLGGAAVTSVPTFLCRIGDILGAILPILIALGVVYFVYGVITYVVGADEEAKKKGRDRIIYGIIGLAVIIGVWGLVRILTNTFGLNNSSTITLPTVQY